MIERESIIIALERWPDDAWPNVLPDADAHDLMDLACMSGRRWLRKNGIVVNVPLRTAPAGPGITKDMALELLVDQETHDLFLAIDQEIRHIWGAP